MCGRIKKRYGNAARKCDRSQRSDQKIQSIYGQGQSAEGAGAVSQAEPVWGTLGVKRNQFQRAKGRGGRSDRTQRMRQEYDVKAADKDHLPR